MTTLFVLLLQLQVQVDVNVNFPAVRFEEAPAMVEVEPGVLVVQDYDEEVFYVSGWYWLRGHDGRWYRTRNHRGGWLVAEPRLVPAVLVRVPPGRYKHHKAKPEKWRVVNADGSITEMQVREKHGVVEVKEKHKKDKHEKHGKHGR